MKHYIGLLLYQETLGNLLKNIAYNQCFIDNNEVHVMNGDEVLDDAVLVLDASIGLIESPRRGEGNTP